MRPCLACERPEHARGLCVRHYASAQRFLVPAVRGVCSVAGCKRRSDARGWCKTHYSQVRRHGRPTPERAHQPAGTRCAVELCRNRPCTRGMCQTHYHAWWKHGGGWRVVMKVARRRAEKTA